METKSGKVRIDTMKKISLWILTAVVVATLAVRADETNKPAEPVSAFPTLKKQQEQLTLETSIADLQLKKELARITAEKQRLELENALNQQKLQAENCLLYTSPSPRD